MNLLNLYANGNLLTLGSRPVTTSGSVNYDTCAFIFNTEWKGFERTAVFAVGDSVCYAVELDDTGVCKIPKECLARTGVLKIGVVGENEDGTVISTNVVTQRIVEGANKDETDFVPVNPETGNSSDDLPSKESAIHLLWQDDSFELDPDFILDDYSLVDETDIHSVYNVIFSSLAEKYPTYVTANVEGQDYSGNDIMSFAFTGSDYDRVILITANHFASSYLTMRALGGFFKNLCENYKKDANLNFLHSKVKFVVLPVVSPETLLGKSRCNSNGVAPFVNYDNFFDESPIIDKGDASFSEPESIPVISAIDTVSAEKCVWYFDFECDNFDDVGKKIYYRANDVTRGNEIRKMASKFDSRYQQTDIYSATELVETNAPIATNYATGFYCMNACTVVWSDSADIQSEYDKSTVKYISFMGTLIFDAAQKCIIANNPDPAPFVRQIIWKAKNTTDYAEIGSSCSPMWVSGYKQMLNGVYNISLNGYITIDSDEPAIARVRPVLYQKNSPEDDYEKRFSNNLFDVEINIPEGKSIIPFSSVLGGKFSNRADGENCTELGVVIAAACSESAKAVSISYTLTANPSDGKNSVEVLTPPGWAMDYTDENTIPAYEIVYPQMYYDIL